MQLHTYVLYVHLSLQCVMHVQYVYYAASADMGYGCVVRNLLGSLAPWIHLPRECNFHGVHVISVQFFFENHVSCSFTLFLTFSRFFSPPPSFSPSISPTLCVLQRDPSPAPGRKGSSGRPEGTGGGAGGANRQREVKERDKLERRLMEVCTCTM